jgi:hypothetical protein
MNPVMDKYGFWTIPAMNPVENSWLEKLMAMEREVAAEKGCFRFFALLLREDSPGKWDLLVSAPWLDANQSDGMSYLAKQVQTRLDTEELLSISRLVFIGKDNPGLQAILRTVHIQHGCTEIGNCRNYFGLEIKRACIITADETQANSRSGPQDAINPLEST